MSIIYIYIYIMLRKLTLITVKPSHSLNMKTTTSKRDIMMSWSGLTRPKTTPKEIRTTAAANSAANNLQKNYSISIDTDSCRLRLIPYWNIRLLLNYNKKYFCWECIPHNMSYDIIDLRYGEMLIWWPFWMPS